MLKSIKFLTNFTISIMIFSNGYNIKAQSTIKSIKIGSQVWMVKNLDVSKFRNGDIIPEVKSVSDWQKAGEKHNPAWCYYDNNKANGDKYGKLYNWYAVTDQRGLAPKGWHIPTLEEFKTLAGSVKKNGNSLKMGTKNPSGFSALLAGTRAFDMDVNNVFSDLGKNTYFWSSTVHDATEAQYMGLNTYGNGSNIYLDSGYKDQGFSVRCISD
jgi:uncharacterized protein (TIGR02145 family)